MFIQSFLSKRSFRVRVGSALSELHEQEMGVPQGGILSPGLSCLEGYGLLLVCGLFCSVCGGKSLNRVERVVQLCVNSVSRLSV